jgi:uncharacterized protein (TIGR02117 family)
LLAHAGVVSHRADAKACLVLAAVLRVGVALLATACTTTGGEVQPAGPAASATQHVYVIRRDQHTGIAVHATDIAGQAWPAQDDLPGADFYEVGWGDRDYYRAADPGLWMGLRALFWPRPGTLHVAALERPIERTSGADRVVQVPVSAAGLERMVRHIGDSHERDRSGRPVVLGPGDYGRSRFYGSRDVFSIARTCNAWTASMLQLAGVPLGAGSWLTAGPLMARLEQIGRPVVPPCEPPCGDAPPRVDRGDPAR